MYIVMGDWIETFDSVFWITAGSMSFAFLAVVLKTALASKCDDLNLCWGCVKIHRRVDLEQNLPIDRGQSQDFSSHRNPSQIPTAL